MQEVTGIHENKISLFDRIDFSEKADPVKGKVRWSPIKSLWWSFMFLSWVILGTLYFSWSSVAIFILTSAVTLCLGHSIGMHRKLIHDAFTCPDWLEKIFVYLGTLVGLGGPFTMMFTHDIRDWAQRQPECHPFLSHRQNIFIDFWQQIHCKLYLQEPPNYNFPNKVTSSYFYITLQHTSMLQQLPLAFILFYFGGWGWVAWGICARVSVSIFGHWIVGYFAHNQGQRDWHINGSSVQGYNVNHLGLITFGECWHNNHHAFPSSANLGLYKEQFDPGWYVLLFLKWCGLITKLKQPADLPERPELMSISNRPLEN